MSSRSDNLKTRLAIGVMLLALSALLAPHRARADTVYAANYSNNTIVSLVLPSVFASNNLLDSPSALAFDRAGNLYVANAFNIERFDTNGVGSVFATNFLSGRITGLAFDIADNLYVANQNDHRIAKFTTNGIGSVFATHIFNTDGDLSGPVSLAFDSEGNLYAATASGNGPNPSTNHLIVKFTTN